MGYSLVGSTTPERQTIGFHLFPMRLTQARCFDIGSFKGGWYDAGNGSVSWAAGEKEGWVEVAHWPLASPIF